MDRVIKKTLGAILNKDMVNEIDAHLMKMYFEEAKEKIRYIIHSNIGRRVHNNRIPLSQETLRITACGCGSPVVYRAAKSGILRITHFSICNQFKPKKHGVYLWADTLTIEKRGQSLVYEC
nr:hypothetical protein K-LCC10_0263 [Kaumoebavirus]